MSVAPAIRPAHLSSGLRKLGADVAEIPFIEIRKPRSYKPLDSALKNLKDYDWLILTSVNGVEALWERLHKLRLTKRRLKHLKVSGHRTSHQKGNRETRRQSECRS